MATAAADENAVKSWLEAHDAAWRAADASAIADLFSEDAVYHLGPWDEPWRGLAGPFRGRDAIAAGWLAGGIEGERFEVASPRSSRSRGGGRSSAAGSPTSRRTARVESRVGHVLGRRLRRRTAAAPSTRSGTSRVRPPRDKIDPMTEHPGASLQERYAPLGRVLRLRARPTPTGSTSGASRRPTIPSTVVAEWMPETQYEAFEGMLNGGIIGALLDCHSNWTATYPPDGPPRRRPAADNRHARLRCPLPAADAVRRARSVSRRGSSSRPTTGRPSRPRSRPAARSRRRAAARSSPSSPIIPHTTAGRRPDVRCSSAS